MNRAETSARLFESWMERVDVSPRDPAWREKCAKLLGKSLRSISYYREGQNIPRDTLLLMDATASGYRPREWGLK